jgi:hypothetical protein
VPSSDDPGLEVAGLARPANSLLLVSAWARRARRSQMRADFGRHYSRVIPSISRGIARAGPAAADLKRAVEQHIAEIRAAA